MFQGFRETTVHRDGKCLTASLSLGSYTGASASSVNRLRRNRLKASDMALLLLCAAERNGEFPPKRKPYTTQKLSPSRHPNLMFRSSFSHLIHPGRFTCVLALIPVASLVLAASVSHAVQQTQSVTVGGGTASLTTDLNAVAFNNSLALFDRATIAAANPGKSVTLNDVVLTFNTQVSTGGSLQNQANQAQTFTFGLGLDSYLGRGTVSGAGAAAQNIIIANFGAGTTGNVAQSFPRLTYTNLPSGSTAGYPTPGNPNAISTLSASPTFTLTDTASLSAFTGVGTLNLNTSTITSTSISGGGGNIAANLNTLAGGSFTITYDYTLAAVPEPSTWMLSGIGAVGGLGLALRQRRRLA